MNLKRGYLVNSKLQIHYYFNDSSHSVVTLQTTVASRLEIELVSEVLDKLLGKLEEIY